MTSRKECDKIVELVKAYDLPPSVNFYFTTSTEYQEATAWLNNLVSEGSISVKLNITANEPNFASMYSYSGVKFYYIDVESALASKKQQ